MTGSRQVEKPDRFLSPEGAEVLKSVVVPNGVAVSCIGWQMGKSLLITRPSATNQQINTVVPDESLVDVQFLYYALSAKRREIFALGAGGSRTPILNKSGFANVRLRLPPLPEQRRIADTLGVLDDKIELNRSMNRTLESIARAIFKSWFIDFDPVRKKMEGKTGGEVGLPPLLAALFPDSLERSAIGPIPQGWPVVPLSELVEINPKYALSHGADAPYVDMTGLPTDAVRVVSWRRRCFTSGSRFRSGDVLVARITPCLENGKTALVDVLEPNETGWGSTEFLVLSSRPPVSPEYVYCLSRSTAFRDFAVGSMNGSSGRQRVPSEVLGRFLVVQPSADVIAAFSQIARRSVGQMAANDRESRLLGDARDALLPRLLSGVSLQGEARSAVRATS